MNDHQSDQEYLREKLALLGEPELPDSLSAESLFRRLDAGELSLPEEGPEKSPKVISWVPMVKRTLPIAACLALVLILYQGYEVGLARNFNSSGAAAPRMAQSSAMDAPAEAERTEDSSNQESAAVSSAPAAAAEVAPEEPEPSPRMKAYGDLSEGSPDTGGASFDKAPENEMMMDLPEEEIPLANPDIGSVTVTEEPSNPDTSGAGAADSETPAPIPLEELAPQMLEIATVYAPEEGLVPVLVWREWNDRDKTKVVFTVHYQAEGQEELSYVFYCGLREEGDALRLELASFRECPNGGH